MKVRWLQSCVALVGCLVLSACAGGGGGSAVPPVSGPQPVPSPALNGLLTDALLVPSPDPALPSPNPQYAAWIGPNSFPIRSLNATTNYSDLHFLDSLLGGVQIVALGESAHGVHEYSEVKVRLIKYLHEHLGFNVLVFESNMLPAYTAGTTSSSVDTPTQAMEEAIFGVWWTPDLVDLFTYIQQHANDPQPLHLNGMDIQYDSGNDISLRGYEFQELLAPIDPAYANLVQSTDTQYCNLMAQSLSGNLSAQATLKNEKATIDAFYASLTAYFDAHMSQLIANRPDPAFPLVAREAAATTKYQVDNVINWPAAPLAAYQARDDGMAADLEYLAKTVYPGQKIIVWSHNWHISEDSEYAGYPPVGAIVRNDYGNAYYAVGLFMHRGQAAYNSGRIFSLAEPPPNAIEDIMFFSNRMYDFVDMEHQAPVPGNAWMFSPQTPFDDWGSYQGVFGTPAKLWNAALFIDTVTPPTYVQSTARIPLQLFPRHRIH